MVQGSRQPRPGGAVKAERYRATEPYPWEYRVTDLLEGRYVATCTIKGMAEVIAAALNAAEDAGRLRPAAQAVIDAADAASGIWTPLEQPLASLRQALKAEPKEETT